MDTNILKFSADGRYVLAQDDSTIFVLSREPFAVLFTIEADDAFPAQFTPDSKAVVFHTLGMRVERWDVASRLRTGAFQLVVRGGCTQNRAVAQWRGARLHRWRDKHVPDRRRHGRAGLQEDSGLLARSWVCLAMADSGQYIRASWYRMASRPTAAISWPVTSREPSWWWTCPQKLKRRCPRPFGVRSARALPLSGTTKWRSYKLEQPDESELIRFPSGESIKFTHAWRPRQLGNKR